MERYQTPIFTDYPLHIRGPSVGGRLFVESVELCAEVGEVFVLACGVGDEVEELRTEAGDDAVVYDAACERVEEAGEGRMVVLKGSCGGGGDALEESRG